MRTDESSFGFPQLLNKLFIPPCAWLKDPGWPVEHGHVSHSLVLVSWREVGIEVKKSILHRVFGDGESKGNLPRK